MRGVKVVLGTHVCMYSTGSLKGEDGRDGRGG